MPEEGAANMENGSQGDLFVNRELSWLEFNRRVLALAHENEVPLGEQLKFAAIYGSNLDEFFMVRVGSLYDRTLLKETAKENKTGMTPAQQLDAIMPKVAELQQHCDKVVERLYEKLRALGYQKIDFSKLGKKQEHFWKTYFLHEIFRCCPRRSLIGGIRSLFCGIRRCIWVQCSRRRGHLSRLLV